MKAKNETPEARRNRLREAQRVLDEQPALPPDEQAYNDQRRAELRAMVDRKLARRHR
jgi:hypothetical protein